MKPNTRKILAIAAKFEQKLYSYAQETTAPAEKKPVQQGSTEVKAFQEALTSFLNTNNKFAIQIRDALNKSINPHWGHLRGSNGIGDADGKIGPRTNTAFNIVRQTFPEVNSWASATKALQDKNTNEADTFARDITTLGQKYNGVYYTLSQRTKNFTIKKKIREAIKFLKNISNI